MVRHNVALNRLKPQRDFRHKEERSPPSSTGVGGGVWAREHLDQCALPRLCIVREYLYVVNKAIPCEIIRGLKIMLI